MRLGIVGASVEAESRAELHLARLLLLLGHGAKRGHGAVDGITKLAKLDFLLRYPRFLERLLKLHRKHPPQVPMLPHEADTVESSMIRFRYGPWDPRYRLWLGLLLAKGLVDLRLDGRRVVVEITPRGTECFHALAARSEMSTLADRAGVVMESLWSLNGTRLKDLVYEAVPELQGMSWGEEIQP
ncbi:MAG: hypothetical protein IT460_05105 [Planctomycetes bacterium]|nr:hypothetical protein [Planctomycetota bacterium]